MCAGSSGSLHGAEKDGRREHAVPLDLLELEHVARSEDVWFEFGECTPLS